MRKFWNDELIAAEIRHAINVLNIDRMPTRTELASIGKSGLSAMIQKTKKFSGWAKELGIETSEYFRVSPPNHDTFDMWSNENAWALGLLTADGSFGGQAHPYSITLYSTDLELLEAYKKVFQLNKETFINHGVKGRLGEKPVGTVMISSKKIRDFLMSINAHGNKDLRNPFQHIPEEFRWSFTKGLFDGDGNVYEGQFSIAGRHALISEVYHWLCEQIGKEPNKIYQATTTLKTFYFQFNKIDTVKVRDYIENYANGTYDSLKFLTLKQVGREYSREYKLMTQSMELSILQRQLKYFLSTKEVAIDEETIAYLDRRIDELNREIDQLSKELCSISDQSGITIPATNAQRAI